MSTKNKKADQIAAKMAHRDRLRVQRRHEPSLEREAPWRAEKPAILIVCERERTEPSYFRRFRLVWATIKVAGEGRNTVSSVKRALALARDASYDQVWCVFDKDQFPDPHFNGAIRLAEENGLHVAYSNQAFEYWLILHFLDHQGGALARKEYHRILRDQLKNVDVSYDGKGSKLITDALFSLLDGVDPSTNEKRVVLAIRRAKGLLEKVHTGANPARQESSTTVFRLVEELLTYR